MPPAPTDRPSDTLPFFARKPWQTSRLSKKGRFPALPNQQNVSHEYTSGLLVIPSIGLRRRLDAMSGGDQCFRSNCARAGGEFKLQHDSRGLRNAGCRCPCVGPGTSVVHQNFHAGKASKFTTPGAWFTTPEAWRRSEDGRGG